MAKSIGATLTLRDGNFFTNLKKASKELGTFNSKTSNAINTIQGFGNGFKSAKNPVDSLKNSVIGLVGAYASLSSIKSIGSLSDEMSQTKARLDMVNDGLQTNEELNSMIFKSARDSRGQYKATADLVTSLGNNCGTVFESTKETVTFAEQLNKRFAIAGAGPEAASNAITQLSQGLAAGALRGDELNSVLEQAPNIARSIESYMGIAQGTIKEAAKEGLVTADVVKNAILSSADETNAKFAQMPMTWGQIWQNIKTTALEKSSPILDTLNQIANGEQFQGLVTKVTEGMGKLADSGAIQTFAEGIMTGADKVIDFIPKLAEGIGTAVGFIKNHWGVISGILTGIGVGIAALKAINIVSSIMKVVQAFGILKNALGIGKLISTLLGGPVGIVVLVIGALVTAFVILWNKCEGFRNFWIGLWEGIKTVASAAWQGITTVFEAIKNTISQKISNIKQAFENAGGGIKGVVAAIWQGIKETFTFNLDFINNLTGGKLTALKNSFMEKLSGLKDKTKEIIDKIKGFFDFEWKLPKLKVPKVEVTGSKKILGVEIPTFSVNWNAKGGIFRRPTVLSTNSGLQGFGEAGAEAILPLSQFWNKLRSYLVERTVNESSTRTNNNVFNISIHADGKTVDEIVDDLVPKLKLALSNL